MSAPQPADACRRCRGRSSCRGRRAAAAPVGVEAPRSRSTRPRGRRRTCSPRRAPRRARDAAGCAGSPRRARRRLLTMSQKTRATPSPSSCQGRSWNVSRSGLARTSASWTRAEAVDRAAVEGHALVEGVLQLGRGDVEGLVAPEHVGEPELDEADPPLLDGAQHVVGLAARTSRLLSQVRTRVAGPERAGQRAAAARFVEVRVAFFGDLRFGGLARRARGGRGGRRLAVARRAPWPSRSRRRRRSRS